MESVEMTLPILLFVGVTLSVVWGLALITFGIQLPKSVIACGGAINPPQQNKVDRINHLILKSGSIRDQHSAMAEEFVELHGYEIGSYEADELTGVIFDGASYEGVMNRIMSRRVA